MIEKVIRDPVHDVISFRLDRPEERLLFGLLNTREFQRLRRVRQLGMASLAYPGADHSRYSHSLGVMETARRMLDRLAMFTRIEEGDRVACLAAALLHDIGHGPFSHVFERVTGVDHEAVTAGVIGDPAAQVHGVLAAFDPQLPARVVEILRGREMPTFLDDVISSQLDADRLDYLLRDNHMTGSRYGDYDLRWLLQALCVDAGSRRLAVSAKGVSAVEAYLQARFHMYRNVYFHKVVRSAEGMVKLALQRAKRLAVQGRLPWPTPESTAAKALLGRRLAIDEFCDLDDVSFFHCFKLWAVGDDAILALLCRGLLNRRLFKTIDISARDNHESWIERAREAVTHADGDPDYHLFVDQASDTPYKLEADEILVCDPSGRASPMGSLSPMTRTLNQRLMFRRIHVAEPYRDAVAEAVGSG